MRRLVLLLVLGLAGLAAGCGPRETLVGRGNREQVLYRALDVDPADLDPHTVTGLAEGKILSTLFEPLVRIDGRTQQPVPALAERWDVSPDGLTYTFHLRPAARWSNGDPVVAQDCIDAWRRLLTPALAADYAYQAFCIRHAEAFHQGRAEFSAVGLVAPDAHTLRVTLERPTPYFLALLPGFAWAPVHLKSIAAQGDPYRRGSAWTRPPHLVGNGPFALRQWTPNQRIVVEKSATYWDSARVRLREIHFLPIDSADTQERAFRAGQLHATDILPLTKVEAYRRDQPEVLRADPSFHTYFLRFNVRHPALRDERVRRALSLAIDRSTLVENILRGGQRPAATLTPPDLPGYAPPERAPVDLAAARAQLAAAGFAGGHGLPPLEILVAPKGAAPVIGEAVQEIWRRDLGLAVSLRQQEQKVIYAERRAGNYQILLSDWLGDYLDPTTFLDLFRGDSGNNHTGWSSPAYDAALAEAARTLEPAARAARLRQAETLLLEAAPIAPLYFNTHVYLLQRAVGAWTPNLLDQVDYARVTLEP